MLARDLKVGHKIEHKDVKATVVAVSGLFMTNGKECLIVVAKSPESGVYVHTWKIMGSRSVVSH